MRTKRIVYNTISRLFYSAVAAVSGLIIPRLILSHFGSDYYGVITSITQFMGYIAILSMGAYSVTQVALFKPLAEENIFSISRIIRASEMFMRKIAFIFAGAVVFFAMLYPFLVIDDFEWSFTFVMVFILGVGPFVQYYLWITYNILLEADQRGYVAMLVHSIALLINVPITAYFIISGFAIQLVYLISALVLMAPVFFIYFFVKKNYKLIKTIEPDVSALKQRWDAFAHQFSNFIKTNSDIVIVTLFLGILEVSVYAVYYLIISSISTLIGGFLGGGILPALGNMFAKNETKSIQDTLRFYEFITNTLSTLLFTCTALLIVQFISIYTTGVYDVNYYRPIFAYLVCTAQFSFMLRMPYESVVYVAGHFKQTRNGAIAEAVIHVVVSLSLVYFLGIVGVAIGALCSTVFRTVQYAFYASQNIVKRHARIAVKKFLISLLSAGIIITISRLLPEMNIVSYAAWILHALPVFGIAVGVTALVVAIFYREEFNMLIKGILRIMNKNAIAQDS